MTNDTEDIKAHMRAMIADARSAFWAGVNAALSDARKHAEGLSSAIGEVSAPIVFEAWKRETAKRLLADAQMTDIIDARSSGTENPDGGDRGKAFEF